MTNAERQRRWRKRHALPMPEWQRGIPEIRATLSLEDELFSYELDPEMRALLVEEVAASEAAVDAEALSDEE